MSDVTIRRAEPGDFAAIDALTEAAYAHDYGASDESKDPMHRAEARAERYDLWLAEDAETGDLLGSVTIRRFGEPPLHEDFLPNELDLRLLGVSPLARRRGVGASLMRHVAEIAKAEGFTAVTLKTAPNMTGAHRLYESLGFQRDAARDGLWVDGVKLFDLYTYVLPLSA